MFKRRFRLAITEEGFSIGSKIALIVMITISAIIIIALLVPSFFEFFKNLIKVLIGQK